MPAPRRPNVPPPPARGRAPERRSLSEVARIEVRGVKFDDEEPTMPRNEKVVMYSKLAVAFDALSGEDCVDALEILMLYPDLSREVKKNLLRQAREALER